MYGGSCRALKLVKVLMATDRPRAVFGHPLVVEVDVEHTRYEWRIDGRLKPDFERAVCEQAVPIDQLGK